MTDTINNTTTYKIGDFVYVDTEAAAPYQIKKIDEIIKSDNNIHIKVQSFCRRRDIPNPLQQLADKHVRELEEDLYNNQWPELNDLQKHQLSHRELYMSRSTGVDTGEEFGEFLVQMYKFWTKMGKSYTSRGSLHTNKILIDLLFGLDSLQNTCYIEMI